MAKGSSQHNSAILSAGFIACLLLLAACSGTRYLTPDQYLLKSNKVNLLNSKKITGKGELKDALARNIIQKPNSNSTPFLPFKVPGKLLRYNSRYRKLRNRPDSSLPKSVERPVIMDTNLTKQSALNIKKHLFNQGYFYAIVKDTFRVSHHKASVTYNVTPGMNYLINKVHYFIDDSDISRLILAEADETILRSGREFTYSLTADERSRLTAILRNSGYYKFTQENITFILDTADKEMFRNAESPFERAVNFIASAKEKKRPTLDVEVHIQIADDTNAFTPYAINTVHVYPDYRSARDLRDTTLLTKKINGIRFMYHRKYVNPGVLYKHIYLYPDHPFSQQDFDKTQAKLGTELGIFQYMRVTARENRAVKGILDYDIMLIPAKKYDFSTLYELSSGSTYALGHSVGISFRDKNFFKGANLLTIGVNGGVELSYNALVKDFFKRFDILTRYYGVNASVDFPKFLAPIAASRFDNSNLPHTIIGVGQNVVERVSYFTLVNSSANFGYSWHETETKTWALSPAFINIIGLPVRTDSFKKVLDSNDYLKNSYKENFIEGESISFTFDDINKRHNVNYSFVKLGLEEAGTVLGGVNKLGGALNDLYKIQYAQYVKFDFDARHYFTLHNYVFAVRFYGGIGLPYGQSSTLPYIKQYFSGGPYSLRGWRIRTLGPGSFFDPNVSSSAQIDRTGDIKLEWNGEFRFPIAPLFAGAVKMNGAIFGDAGNIWLTRKDAAYPNGELAIDRLDQDIATDIGAGTRFDIASFLTLRLDVAIPVKKPYVAANNGWVFDAINFDDATWRSNNLILNISIGYPF